MTDLPREAHATADEPGDEGSEQVSLGTSGEVSEQLAGEVADQAADVARIERRADLLPEERAAGSDDPEEQARAILAESDERTEHPEETRHESVQTPD